MNLYRLFVLVVMSVHTVEALFPEDSLKAINPELIAKYACSSSSSHGTMQEKKEWAYVQVFMQEAAKAQRWNGFLTYGLGFFVGQIVGGIIGNLFDNRYSSEGKNAKTGQLLGALVGLSLVKLYNRHRGGEDAKLADYFKRIEKCPNSEITPEEIKREDSFINFCKKKQLLKKSPEFTFYRYWLAVKQKQEE